MTSIRKGIKKALPFETKPSQLRAEVDGFERTYSEPSSQWAGEFPINQLQLPAWLEEFQSEPFQGFTEFDEVGQELEFEAEPFQGYTDFDELEAMNSEAFETWSEETGTLSRPIPRTAPARPSPRASKSGANLFSWLKPQTQKIQRSCTLTGPWEFSTVPGDSNASPAFKTRVQQMAAKLCFDPSHLMAIISYETLGTFDPASNHPRKRTHNGIVPFSVKMDGISEDVRKMSALDQLKELEKYLTKLRQKKLSLATLEALYMAILSKPEASNKGRGKIIYPDLMREPDEPLVQDDPRRAFDSQPQDGYVTVGEAADKVRGWVKTQQEEFELFSRFNLARQGEELNLEADEFEWLDPEAFELSYEWMGEVSRSSREYIRWVQTSLNQIMSLRLAVDGISGPLTRSAVRSFQTRAKILVDGIVGPQTEGALIAAGAQPPPGATPSPGGGSGAVRPPTPLAPLTAAEQSEFSRLNATAQAQFNQLRTLIESYRDVARREADRGSRALLRQGHFRQTAQLLPEIIRLTNITTLPSGWSLSSAKPLLVGNVLYNLAFPETINQGGTDRLGGTADPTCFSACTQILLARRFPATYVRLTIQLATTSKVTFAGGASIGPITFKSTNLYRSLESVLLQTAFDTYFRTVAIVSGNYRPGDELKVHRQVFGSNRPPRFVTWKSSASKTSAFRTAFVTKGGNTRPWESINLCTGNPAVSCGNHAVVLTRVTGGRVYFYNPWANEEEKARMFGTAQVSVSGNGERPAESSMTQADFEGQLTSVFHN